MTTALLSLFPGLVTWWWDRGLIRLADDAALPERLAEYRNRLAQVTAAAGLVMLTGAHAWWALPVAIAGVVAGRQPLHRVLFGLGTPALGPADGAARWPVAGVESGRRDPRPASDRRAGGTSFTLYETR